MTKKKKKKKKYWAWIIIIQEPSTSDVAMFHHLDYWPLQWFGFGCGCSQLEAVQTSREGIYWHTAFTSLLRPAESLHASQTALPCLPGVLQSVLTTKIALYTCKWKATIQPVSHAENISNQTPSGTQGDLLLSLSRGDFQSVKFSQRLNYSKL